MSLLRHNPVWTVYLYSYTAVFPGFPSASPWGFPSCLFKDRFLALACSARFFLVLVKHILQQLCKKDCMGDTFFWNNHISMKIFLLYSYLTNSLADYGILGWKLFPSEFEGIVLIFYLFTHCCWEGWSYFDAWSFECNSFLL